jgi:protein subunit release factor A
MYGLSNTTTENLWAARSVSTIENSQSVSSTQSQEFVALQQHTAHLTKKYEQLLEDYEQLRQMIMDIRSQMGGTCAPPFWSYGLGNDQPPPPPSPAPPLF